MIINMGKPRHKKIERDEMKLRTSVMRPPKPDDIKSSTNSNPTGNTSSPNFTRKILPDDFKTNRKMTLGQKYWYEQSQQQYSSREYEFRTSRSKSTPRFDEDPEYFGCYANCNFSKGSFPPCFSSLDYPVPPACPPELREKDKSRSRRRHVKSVSRSKKQTSLKTVSELDVKLAQVVASPKQKRNAKKSGSKSADKKSASKKNVIDWTNIEANRLCRVGRVKSKSPRRHCRKAIRGGDDLTHAATKQNVDVQLSKGEGQSPESKVRAIREERRARLAAAEPNVVTESEDELSSDAIDIHPKVGTQKHWAIKNKVLKDIEAVKIEKPRPSTIKVVKKKNKKIIRGPPRVGRLFPSKFSEKIAHEQARVAVQELCRQASAVMNHISPPTSRSTSPDINTKTCIKEFKEKVQKGKGKKKILTEQISMVSYPSPQMLQIPNSIPRTYQQLGLAPLTRSPSSQNYFPNMVPFLRGDEGNIPAVLSPPKWRDGKGFTKVDNPADKQMGSQVKAKGSNVITAITKSPKVNLPRKSSFLVKGDNNATLSAKINQQISTLVMYDINEAYTLLQANQKEKTKGDETDTLLVKSDTDQDLDLCAQVSQVRYRWSDGHETSLDKENATEATEATVAEGNDVETAEAKSSKKDSPNSLSLWDLSSVQPIPLLPVSGGSKKF